MEKYIMMRVWYYILQMNIQTSKYQHIQTNMKWDFYKKNLSR